jgi:hypothetical protein
VYNTSDVLSSPITNYTRCTRGIQSRTATAKAEFNKKRVHFIRKFNLNLSATFGV